MVVTLGPRQAEAVEKLGNGKILYGGMGVGKSITAMAYYVAKVCNGVYNEWESMRSPKDVYVITTAKKRDSLDWEEEAIKFGVSKNRQNSIDHTQIVVDSWNNLSKYEGVEDAFFIFDEQRVVGYGAWSKSFIKIAQHNQWILLSATPGDTWMDYIPVMIANGFYKHKTDFVDQHVVWQPYVKYQKVQRYINTSKLIKHRNALLVHLPYERTTPWERVDIRVEYDQELFEKVVKSKWHVYENRPLREAGELYSVARKVVNSDSSRLKAVRDLIEKHPRLIVFYNFDYELEMLRTLGSQEQAVSWSMDSTSPSTASTLSAEVSSGATSTATRTTPSTHSSATRPGSMTTHRPTSTATRNGIGDKAWQDYSDSSMASGKTSGPALRSTRSGSPTASSTKTSSPRTAGSTTSTSTATATHISSRFPRNGTTHSGSCTTGTSPCSVDPRMGPVRGRRSMTVFVPRNGSITTASQVSPSLDGRDGLVVAEWNGHKHEPVPSGARWLYLVQYRAGAEGWNCIETDAICFFSQTYSFRDWWQAHGRIDRRNTPFAKLFYYYLKSASVMDRGISRALKEKRNFNERDLAFAA